MSYLELLKTVCIVWRRKGLFVLRTGLLIVFFVVNTTLYICEAIVLCLIFCLHICTFEHALHITGRPLNGSSALSSFGRSTGAMDFLAQHDSNVSRTRYVYLSVCLLQAELINSQANNVTSDCINSNICQPVSQHWLYILLLVLTTCLFNTSNMSF